MVRIQNVDWEVGIKEVADKSVDLLLTDPPYGMEFQSNYRKVKHKSIQNDNNLDWLVGWVDEIKRVMKPEAHLYVFCSWHNVEVFKHIIGKKFNVKNILIWEKNNTGMGDLEGDYAPKYEMVLFCSNGAKKLKGGRDSNILKADKTGNVNHPTEKPINLISYFINKSSNIGDLVLDTFGGSCVTAIASKQLQRNCICFEIEESYCKNAQTRLSATDGLLF